MTFVWLLSVALTAGLTTLQVAAAADEQGEAVARRTSRESRVFEEHRRSRERLRALRTEPDEAADQSAAPAARPAPTYSAADLQRWLSDPRRGGDPTASTPAGYWIDPVCTGYGPGLGPEHVRIRVLDAGTVAALARARPQSPPPRDPTEAGPPK